MSNNRILPNTLSNHYVNNNYITKTYVKMQALADHNLLIAVYFYTEMTKKCMFATNMFKRFFKKCQIFWKNSISVICTVLIYSCIDENNQY